jgi:hypothetical protein
MPTDEARLWKVVISLTATTQQKDDLCDRFVETICPDPDHDGPCEIPWALHVTAGDSLDSDERQRLLTEIHDTMHG